MRIILAGPSRCGKDTGAEFIRDHTGLRFAGSASQYLLPYVASEMELTVEWLQAHRHEPAIRELLFAKGNELRDRDPSVLVRQVWQENDILIGFRDPREIRVLRDMVSLDDQALFVWVDRDVAQDPTLLYGPEVCDVVVWNHGTLEEYYGRLARLLNFGGLRRAAGPL